MKPNQLLFLCALLLVATVSACIEPPVYPPEPRITNVAVSPGEIEANDPSASLFFQIFFEDGDGDISNTEDDQFDGIFIRDTRFEASVPYPIREFIDNSGNNASISGIIEITYFGTICEDPEAEFETTTFEVQMMDRARNMSNIVETQPIRINCGR